jgi:hypothetical protein
MGATIPNPTMSRATVDQMTQNPRGNGSRSVVVVIDIGLG